MMIDYPGIDRIPELKTLWGKCFPDPDAFIHGFFETGFSSERCRCLTDGGKPVAALYWFDGAYKGEKLAYLYAVATDPGYRGKGLCRRLMEDTHALLKQQGYAAAMLMPGEPGLRRMYEKFGYREQCDICEHAWEARGNVQPEEISWEKYSILRRDFLPENGAVQQGLDFLATYARFYRGKDFLLAAAREGETLLGLELLGNRAQAPGILSALGCKKGTFRSPGTGRKTVMALPLKEGVSLPGYVGLTFD